MKTCRVCSDKNAVNKLQICQYCVNVKHFKCFCCDQKFSYTELNARNLNIGSKYKCTKLRMTRSKCAVCEKPSCLLINYNFRCLRCTNKDNVRVKLEGVEKRLLTDQESKTAYMERIEYKKRCIYVTFDEMQNIKDPVFEQRELFKIIRSMESLYCELNTDDARLVGYNERIQQLKNKVVSLQSEINKLHNATVCYDAAKTFMLCGLRPEVRRYISKQIQRVIVMYVLREFFICA